MGCFYRFLFFWFFKKLFAMIIDRSDLNCNMHAKLILMDKMLCFYCESMLSVGLAGWFSC